MKKENKKKENFGLRPLGDRLILKEVKEKEKNVSGIYIPETVKEDKGAKLGEVLAVGEGKVENGKVIPVKVKIGDRVLYQWGDTINYKGEDYVIVRESEVVAVVK